MIKAVIFDFGYTIYDPDKEQLVSGATMILKSLRERGLKLALVSRTQDIPKRIKQIKNLGLNEYFDFVEATPREGTKDFKPIIEKFRVNSREFLVVGDRVRSEIKIGNSLGMETCQLLYGPRVKEVPEEPNEEPDHKINKLSEVLNLI